MTQQLYLKYKTRIAEETGMKVKPGFAICENCGAEDIPANTKLCPDCAARQCVMCDALVGAEEEPEPGAEIVCARCRYESQPEVVEARREAEFWAAPGWADVFKEDE